MPVPGSHVTAYNLACDTAPACLRLSMLDFMRRLWRNENSAFFKPKGVFLTREFIVLWNKKMKRRRCSCCRCSARSSILRVVAAPRHLHRHLRAGRDLRSAHYYTGCEQKETESQPPASSSVAPIGKESRTRNCTCRRCAIRYTHSPGPSLPALYFFRSPI